MQLSLFVSLEIQEWGSHFYWKDFYLCLHVLVRGLEMGYVEVPLHHICLDSKLLSGDVVVGVCAMLPIPGVTFILCNDLAGGHV